MAPAIPAILAPRRRQSPLVTPLFDWSGVRPASRRLATSLFEGLRCNVDPRVAGAAVEPQRDVLAVSTAI